jgi:putative MATE family efflux protein
MEEKNRLETEPVTGLIFKLAIPTVLAQLVNLLYNIVDRVYVGRIPETGSLSLAGLGVTFPIILLVSAFAMLAGMGGASRAAVSMGAKDKNTAEKILGNTTTLLIVFSIVLSVGFMLTKDFILTRFGASEVTLPYASEYISIYLVGTVFVQLSLGLNMFITNQGFTKTSMMTVCIGAVLNIALDPIFIYGFGMGVRGAAAATVISQAVSCAWVVKFLTGKKTVLKIKPQNLKLKKKTVISILSLGISPFIMQATECLIQLTFNNGMLRYGNDLYVALMSILFSLMQLIWMPLQGFSQGAAPVIGYNFGAGKTDRVKKAFKLQFTVNLSFSLAAIALVELFPNFFLGLFTNDTALMGIGTNTTRLFLAGMAVMGAQSACQQTFLALGEAKISMFLACLRKVILLFPLALILPKVANMGVWGLLLAEPVSDVIAASCTTTMFYFRSKKILK